MSDLYDLWLNYRDKFNLLLNIEKDSFNTFKPDSSLAEINDRFSSGYIPKKRKRNKNIQLSMFT